MPQNAKPVALNKKHLTKKEKQERLALEERYKPNNDKVKPPQWLDKLGKREFKRISKELLDLDLITNVDVHMLAIYCDAYTKYLEATKQINENGLTDVYVNAKGEANTVISPFVKIQKNYIETIKKVATEFGLTISSRMKLTVTKEEEKIDEFSDMFD